jgi:hypothetical protein
MTPKKQRSTTIFGLATEKKSWNSYMKTSSVSYSVLCPLNSSAHSPTVNDFLAGARLPHPINIKGPWPIESYHPIKQTFILLFISKLYFFDPFASFFISTVIYGVLSGLPIFEQP